MNESYGANYDTNYGDNYGANYGSNYGTNYGPGGAPIGDRVMLYPDGKYRWIYEVNLFTNPTVLIDVIKVFLISIGIMALIGLFIILISGDFDLDAMAGLGMGMGIAAGIMIVLSIVGYFVYALIAGGKYVVLFTMDEREVEHRQMPKEVKRAHVIGALTVLAGLLSGRPGVAGTGLLAASRTSMVSELGSVKRVIPRRSMHMIKVNETLEKNRVYVPDADFDFVLSFLQAHCPRARR